MKNKAPPPRLTLFGALRERLTRPRRFRLTLAQATPLIDGPETRRVARAIRYDVDRAVEMIKALPLEPRDTYCQRALEWARHG